MTADGERAQAGELPVLASGRVRARPGRPGDAVRLHAILAEPSVSRWWGEPDPVPVIEEALGGPGPGGGPRGRRLARARRAADPGS